MLIAFVGKGGVGKTTISSAIALSLSKLGYTALVSSDFMPSLKYLFPSSPPNLDIIETSQKDISNNWKKKFGEEVTVVLKNLFEFEDWMLDHVAESPGVIEEFLISNIVDIEMSSRYRFVVWDTAASSSTMHLILLQKEFYDHLSRDVKFYLKLRDTIRTDKILDLLDRWKDLARTVWMQILSTRFYLVTTGDELSLVQASEITEDLKRMGIKVSGKICNRSHSKCSEDAILTIPELRGNAREMVSEISNRILENSELISNIANSP